MKQNTKRLQEIKNNFKKNNDWIIKCIEKHNN